MSYFFYLTQIRSMTFFEQFFFIYSFYSTQLYIHICAYYTRLKF